MQKKSILVEIIETKAEKIKVKLPNMDFPIEMSPAYFVKWFRSGHFKMSVLSKRIFERQFKELVPLLT